MRTPESSLPLGRRVRGWVEQMLAPGYGACYRCGKSWRFHKGHMTGYEGCPFSETAIVTLGGHPIPSGDPMYWKRSCFPLCECCWSELDPDTRLPYYCRMWENWWRNGPPEANWADIEVAVRAGR